MSIKALFHIYPDKNTAQEAREYLNSVTALRLVSLVASGALVVMQIIEYFSESDSNGAFGPLEQLAVATLLGTLVTTLVYFFARRHH